MSTLVETLKITREETIRRHYGEAQSELMDKVSAEPLRTNFHIRAGCVSIPIMEEIARRFVKTGLKARVVPPGFIRSGYVEVEVSLQDEPWQESITEKSKVLRV